MIDFDQETWIYLAIISVFSFYFIWNSRLAKQHRKAKKNQNFRKRYLERRQREKAEAKQVG